VGLSMQRYDVILDLELFESGMDGASAVILAPKFLGTFS
jgi:hypothetical protein